MKFTQKLSAHLTPEWRLQYINYEVGRLVLPELHTTAFYNPTHLPNYILQELKSMLYVAVETAPVISSYDMRSRRQHYVQFDEKFFQECEQELQKINTFYAEKLAEATRKHAGLMLELRHCREIAEKRSQIALNVGRNARLVLPKRRVDDLKFGFSESYLSLVLLQNYQTLNHTGFRKILKKHDKLLHTDQGLHWFDQHVNNSFFYTNHDLIKLIQETENSFTTYLESGDRTRAMKRLRVPPLSEVNHPWTIFRVGLFLGAVIVLMFVLTIAYNQHTLSSEDYTAGIHLFRGPFQLTLFLFLISINMHGWRRAGVNHILIFEIEPRDHLAAAQVVEMATIFALIWFLSFLGFIYAHVLGIPLYVFPLILPVITLAFLFNPIHVFHYTSRRWLVKLVGRVVSAPFFHVGFADFWLGDQMNSLVNCFVDYEYIVCFYWTNWNWHASKDAKFCDRRDFVVMPIVRCLPAWFRFAQCLRRYRDNRTEWQYLVNAGKYASTFPVVYFMTMMNYTKPLYESTFDNPNVWGYIISYIIQTCYCYAWDVIRDFGVFAKFSGENIFLREQIVYKQSFYYFAIIEDLVIRFFWALNLTLVEMKLAVPHTINTIGACLEIFRRYIWNYFRLENEHLNNAGKFRAVRDISILPIDQTDQIALTRMMDEEDGVETQRQSTVKKLN